MRAGAQTASRPERLTPPAPKTTEEILVVRGLRKVFGGLTAVADVSFELRRGEILGVIGPNGAGKTTVFTMLSGFQRPTSGTAQFSGRNIEQLEAAEICKMGIARTFQIPQLFDSFTVAEAIAAGGLNRSGRLLAVAHAQEIAHDMELDANKPCSVLTLAERRRLEIARAVATQPQVILLDEVLAGLTPKEVAEALQLIRRLRDSGISVVLIEHNMKAVMSVCDRIVVLDLGKVLATGRPDEVTTDERVIAAYLGKGSAAAGKPGAKA
ncbi:MAG: ABC transporter ATP-binding protein [Burkholderiaceae bacterium]|nr:ABC transporter ATP-binding protein [Burkholderiaceae bacterium]